MTIISMTANQDATDAPEPAEQRDEDWADVFLDPADDGATPEFYPRLSNVSAAFIYQAILRAEAPTPPEYVTLPMRNTSQDARFDVAVSEWNMVWEAAQFRGHMFDHEELPPQLAKIHNRGDINVVFVPRTRSRYHEHAPLFHLLSGATLQRFGLPMLHRGQWPFLADWRDLDRYLPAEFDAKLSQAWASTVWRHLTPGSRMSGFSKTEPIRLLAHNLDFWIPPVNSVIQDVLGGFPLVDKGTDERRAEFTDGSLLDGAVIANPRMGGDVWTGEDAAAEAVRWTVDKADTHGNLRGILDAVRSHRVQDDFSDTWTYAREDFERKLYSKRSKCSVKFVELPDNIPVQGPETEVVGQQVFGAFLALLNEPEREVVILLSKGFTNLTEIGKIMGYRSHSPISKQLKKIRIRAAEVLGCD